MNKLTWAKFSDTAIVPTKRVEDAGFDIYCDHSALGLSDSYVLKANETKRFDSNIGVVIPDGYVGVVKERSSTGKLSMFVGAGVIDSGYRYGIGVFVTNTSDDDIVLDLNKAIAQMVVFECLHDDSSNYLRLTPEEFKDMFPSVRGLGREGDSGK